MKIITWLAACLSLGCMILATGGCAKSDDATKDESDASAKAESARPTAKSATAEADDPAAVAAIEKMGGKFTRNAAGNAIDVDLSRAKLKELDFGALKRLPSLARVELVGADVNNDTLD